jgi:hypothetical protein
MTPRRKERKIQIKVALGERTPGGLLFCYMHGLESKSIYFHSQENQIDPDNKQLGMFLYFIETVATKIVYIMLRLDVFFICFRTS